MVHALDLIRSQSPAEALPPVLPPHAAFPVISVRPVLSFPQSYSFCHRRLYSRADIQSMLLHPRDVNQKIAIFFTLYIETTQQKKDVSHPSFVVFRSHFYTIPCYIRSPFTQTSPNLLPKAIPFCTNETPLKPLFKLISLKTMFLKICNVVSMNRLLHIYYAMSTLFLTLS